MSAVSMSVCTPSIKRKLEEEEKEPLDMETLCANLSVVEGTAARAANEVIVGAPDLLFEIAKYKKERLLQLFEKSTANYDQRDRLRSAVLILYSHSLTNSRYRKSVETLEDTIRQQLPTSDVSHARQTLERASSVLSQEPGATLEAIQEQLKQLRHIATEIENFLKLFYYADAEEEIKNIYRFTRQGEYSRFPQCKRFFPQLCQNLSLCQKEKGELSQLRRQLVQKITTLTQKQATCYAETPDSKLPVERERFLEYQGALLWEIGSSLLTEGFNQTITQKKKNPRFFVPQDFVHAINRAARTPELKFQRLIQRRNSIPIQFISEVWSAYASSDLLSLMRYAVEKASDATFAQIQKGDWKALQAEISGPSPLTFMRLRDWLVENRANS